MAGGRYVVIFINMGGWWLAIRVTSRLAWEARANPYATGDCYSWSPKPKADKTQGPTQLNPSLVRTPVQYFWPPSSSYHDVGRWQLSPRP